jgi:gamma-glutamyltranspeptidase/glutathione hydrolase
MKRRKIALALLLMVSLWPLNGRAINDYAGMNATREVVDEERPSMISNEIKPAVGSSGMVSAAHPLAAQAGVDILRAGGNAFDAAVAVAATLNVVEPMMSGLGGYGTIVIYDAKKGEARFLDSSGRIPAALNSDVFRQPTSNYQENRRGAKSVTTPGTLKAWEAMSKNYGQLAWARLFDGAIRAAEEGFAINEQVAGSIKSGFNSFPEHARAFYGRDEKPLQAGERLVQKELAQTFKVIAQKGADAFYGGAIGQAIDAAMREAGGFLSIKDLTAHRAEWWKPIQIAYRGYEVVTASPPANAFDMLVRLGLMSQFDLAKLGHNSTAYLHRFAEATKHGFWVRLRYAGDPDFNPPPLDKLLSEGYWKEEAAKINLQRAAPFTPPGSVTGGQHTTHFVVADKWGNVVSATQTLGGAFGCSVMPKGTGIWLNNSLSFSTFEPKGNPMDAFPGRRKLSGDCPTLIMRGGKVWAAIGTPGGHTIGQTVPQMIINLIDFKMDIQQAISAGRISFIEPDAIAVEDSIPEAARQELAAMGHNVRSGRRLGNAHGLTIEYDAQGKPKQFTGGSDPRGGGQAIGY